MTLIFNKKKVEMIFFFFDIYINQKFNHFFFFLAINQFLIKVHLDIYLYPSIFELYIWKIFGCPWSRGMCVYINVSSHFIHRCVTKAKQLSRTNIIYCSRRTYCIYNANLKLSARFSVYMYKYLSITFKVNFCLRTKYP